MASISLLRRFNPGLPSTLAAIAILLGAFFLTHPAVEPVGRVARAQPWTAECGAPCGWQTVAYDPHGNWQWVQLAYVPTKAAFAVSSFRPAFAAVVIFDDGRRFVFDNCRDRLCWLPSGESAVMLQRLRGDVRAALRVHSPFVGTTGLIDLPRLDIRVSTRVVDGTTAL